MNKQKEIPMRASRGLKWENKMYKPKRSITTFSRDKQTPKRQRLISGVISTADVKQWKQNIRNNDP